jgi:hypothetical protein
VRAGEVLDRGAEVVGLDVALLHYGRDFGRDLGAEKETRVGARRRGAGDGGEIVLVNIRHLLGLGLPAAASSCMM